MFAAERDSYFDENHVAEATLDATLAAVDGPGGTAYFDPFGLFYPPSSAPPDVQGMTGYSWSKDKGLRREAIPVTDAARSSRAATFTGVLEADGTLRGKGQILWTGISEGRMRSPTADWEAREVSENLLEEFRERQATLTVTSSDMDRPRIAAPAGFAMRADVTARDWAVDEGGEWAMGMVLLSPEVDAGKFTAARRFPVEWDYRKPSRRIAHQTPSGLESR